MVSGKFDVGNGVELYMECEGTESPTILYLHGSIEQATFFAPSSSANIRASMGDDYRFCSYNRRNVGFSDTVDGYFTGLTAVEDLHGLMAAAGIDPPYVLLGASFGGLIAHLYAASYPEDVVGIVSLDGMIPKDITLDPLVPEDMRYQPDEDRNTLERLSHYATLHEALDMNPPDVPFHYLLAMPSNWSLGVPAYDDVILDVVADYVASYPQGELFEVESPHYMEPAVPDTIAEHLRQVIQEAGY
jgi:pimeloyl-ACP methyl ester carboxylesterase